MKVVPKAYQVFFPTTGRLRHACTPFRTRTRGEGICHVYNKRLPCHRRTSSSVIDRRVSQIRVPNIRHRNTQTRTAGHAAHRPSTIMHHRYSTSARAPPFCCSNMITEGGVCVFAKLVRRWLAGRPNRARCMHDMAIIITTVAPCGSSRVQFGRDGGARWPSTSVRPSVPQISSTPTSRQGICSLASAGPYGHTTAYADRVPVQLI